MSWNSAATTDDNLLTQEFTLQVEGHPVPGVYWAPSAGAQRLVLLGHGGTTHKKVDYIVGVAKLLCARGIAAMAIDGPGHGDRAAQRRQHDPGRVDDPGADDFNFDKAWHSEGGTPTVIADWRAALDFIEAEHGVRPAGWWGLSMGTMMGLPVCASDGRIKVALLGLMGVWGPNGSELKQFAGQLKCPVRFLVQWDDEIVPRDTCIELFGLLATPKKTMHINPGAHSAVPNFEVADSVDYLAKHLR